MEKLLGKNRRQIDNKLTEETIQEICKNLASVLKPIPDCGSMNKSMFCMAGLKAEASRQR
jgi:protein required for attachment to host cells